jgi:hypothetical protein
MSTKKIHRVLFAFVIAILLLASFLAGRMYTQPMNVLAQEIPEDEDRAIATFAPCTVIEVAMYNNRAHIRCVETVGTTEISFFAIANTTANQSLINRVLAIGLTQMSMNRVLYIQYDTNSANNPVGCLVSNCRKLVGIMGYK